MAKAQNGEYWLHFFFWLDFFFFGQSGFSRAPHARGS